MTLPEDKGACENMPEGTPARSGFGDFMRQRTTSTRGDPDSTPPPHFKSRRPYFSPSVERQVLFALDFINSQVNETVRDLFRVALGSVMVSFSNYSYEPSLGTRAAAGKQDVLDADVRGVLLKKLREMAADISFMQRCLSCFPQRPRADVHAESFLTGYRSLSEGSVDALITSPPT